MPIVKIEILKGFSQEYKSGIINGIHAALLTAFKIPENDLNQRLIEYEKGELVFSPLKYSDKYTHIEISIFKGRSFVAKKRLYLDIVQNLNRKPGIDGKDITIILNEIPLENWGIRGGIPANEVNFEFDINV